MVLGGAIYWWFIDVWAWHSWIHLVNYLMGQQQFRSVEQQFVIRIPHGGGSWTIIDSFVTFLSLIFFCFAIIPLYVGWALWYRRRESYLTSMAGVEDV